MKLDLIKPYDDDKLVFNQETGRYELTFEFVKKTFEINFKDDDTLKKRITKNSRKIYNLILYRCYTANKPVVDMALNRTENGRKFLFDVLLEQFEADNETGFNDLSSTPAINYTNGSVIDRNLQYANQISVDAEQIIDRNAEYFGFNILYQGQLPLVLYKLANEGNL